MLSASNPHHLRAFILIPMCPHQTGWRTELIDADITNKFVMSASTRSGTCIRYLPWAADIRYRCSSHFWSPVGRAHTPTEKEGRKRRKREEEGEKRRGEKKEWHYNCSVIKLCYPPTIFTQSYVCTYRIVCKNHIIIASSSLLLLPPAKSMVVQ